MLRSGSPIPPSLTQTHSRTPSCCFSRENSPASTPSPYVASTRAAPYLQSRSPKLSSTTCHIVRVKDSLRSRRSRSCSPAYTQEFNLTMSGPDRVQDTETKTMHELKEVQQRDSRIKISNLLCSIEAAEPPKSSSWEPSRTEAVHLESRSPQSPSRSPARSWQSTQHIQGEYAYRRHSEATRYSFEHFASNSSLRIPSNNNRDTQQYSTTLRPKAIEQDGPAYTRRASANVHDTRYPLDRRDSGLGRRDPEMRDAGYSPYERSYNSNGGDRVSHSTLGETKAQAPSSPLGYNAPRPAAVVQRPASLHADHYYQDNCHPYDTDTPRPRTDRSKSDFALHQQNYGPYSNASPPLVPAPLFQPKEPQQLSAPGTSHYHDHTTSPAMSHEPSYPSAYGPRRSVQSDVRRPSQGILLPEVRCLPI